MKFVHLSDLHIGKRVNEVSMIEDQEHILRQIVDIIDSEKVQAVLVSGDVYDKSVPSAEAVSLLDDFLFELAAPEEKVFSKVLDKFYHGRRDGNTLRMLGIR